MSCGGSFNEKNLNKYNKKATNSKEQSEDVLPKGSAIIEVQQTSNRLSVFCF